MEHRLLTLLTINCVHSLSDMSHLVSKQLEGLTKDWKYFLQGHLVYIGEHGCPKPVECRMSCTGGMILPNVTY